MRTPSAFLPAKRLCTQRAISTTKRNWKVVPANSSYEGALSMAVSDMVARMVRHYDQDERQSDASLRESVRKTWSRRSLRNRLFSTQS